MALLHGLILVVAREKTCWSCGLLRVNTDPKADIMAGFVMLSCEPDTHDKAVKMATKEAGRREPILGHYRYTALLPGEFGIMGKASGKPGPTWVEFTDEQIRGTEPFVDNPLNLYRAIPLAVAHARKTVAA